MKAALLKRLTVLEANAKRGRTITLVVFRDLGHDCGTYLRFDDGGHLVGAAADKELDRAKRDGRLDASLAMMLWDVNLLVALGLERHPDERMAMEEATGDATHTVEVPADEVGDLAGQESEATPSEATPSEGEDALTQEQREVAEAIEAGKPVELPPPLPEPTRTIQWLDF